MPPSLRDVPGGPFGTAVADPPWSLLADGPAVDSAPGRPRTARRGALSLDDIAALPVQDSMANPSHCYLWVPHAFAAEGLHVLRSWGYDYKTMIVWAKRASRGGFDGGCGGFYFREVTEMVLFGVRGKLRTLPPGRKQVNMIEAAPGEPHGAGDGTRLRPSELYEIAEDCSPGPYVELFTRHGQNRRARWSGWSYGPA